MANSRFNKKKKGESEKDSLSVKKSFTIGNEKANDEVKTVKRSFDVTKPTTTQKKTVTVPQQQSQKKYAPKTVESATQSTKKESKTPTATKKAKTYDIQTKDLSTLALREKSNESFEDFKKNNGAYREIPHLVYPKEVIQRRVAEKREQESANDDKIGNILGAITSFKEGLNNGLSFGLADKIDEKSAKRFGLSKQQYYEAMSNLPGMNVNPYYSTKAVTNEAKEQHSTANLAGNIGGQIISSGLVGGAASNGVEKALTSKLGGNGLSALQKYGIGVGADLVGDIATDTIPQLIQNTQDGKTANEIATDAGKNIAINTAINMVGNGLLQGIPQLLKNRNSAKAVSDSAQDAVEQVVKKATQTTNKTDNVFDYTKKYADDFGTDDDAVYDYIKSHVSESKGNKNALVDDAMQKNADGTYSMTQAAKDRLKSDASDYNVNNDYATALKRKISQYGHTYGKSIDGIDDSIAAARQSVDDFFQNPSDENFLKMGNDLVQFDSMLQGTKKFDSRYKTDVEYGQNLRSYLGSIQDDLFTDTAKATQNAQSVPVLNKVNNNVEINATKNLIDSEGIPQLKSVNEDKLKVSKVRTNTAENSGAFTHEEGMQNLFPTNFMYESKTEQESIQQAEQFISQLGADKAWKQLKNRETYSQVDVDSAMTLWKNKVAEAKQIEANGGDSTQAWESASEMLRKIKDQTSNSAQNLQALAKWSRSTPEGIVAEALSVAQNKAKGVLGEKAAKECIDNLPASVQSQIYTLAEDVFNYGAETKEGKYALAQIGKVVNANTPKGFGNVITTFLMDNMLGNFRTLISRNAGGNLFYNAAEFARQPITATADKLLSLKTGKRTRTGWDADKISAALGGLKKGVVDELSDVKNGVHTLKSGTNTMQNAIQANTHAFKGNNALTKAFNKIDDFVKHGLSAGDRPFYEAAYAQRLSELNTLRSKGQLGQDVMKLSDADFDTFAKASAQLDGLEATYQNKGLVSEGFTKLKEGLGKASEGVVGKDILSQFSMPFVATPANIVEKSLEYTPLGFVRNGLLSAIEAKKGNFNQQRFVDELGRNVLGTGLMAGGIAAYDNGLITGGYSDDKDMKNAQKNAGQQEYALNTGNGNFDISWVPVIGNDLVAAAAMKEAYDNAEDGAIGKGISAGLDAILGQSMLQGLQRIMGGGQSSYSSDGIGDNILNAIQSGLGQGIPSLVRQVAQVSDDYERNVSDGDREYWQNSIISSIPVLRENLLQPKVDTNGNLVQQNQGRSTASKILENMISPGKYTELSDDVANGEAMRLYESTGNNYAFIPTPNRSDITTDDYTPTDEDFMNYSITLGKNNTQAAEAVISSDFYKSLSDEKKEAVLQDVYSAMKALSKESHVSGYETDNKLVEAYKDGGFDEMIEYLEYRDTIKSNGLSDSDKLREVWNESGASGISEYKHTKDTFKAYGYDSTPSKDSSAYEVYTDKGESGLKTFESIKSAATYKTESGNDARNQTSVYKALADMDMSEEDKGYYASQLLPSSDKYDAIFEQEGYAGIYRYMEYKEGADSDGNGSLKKDEIISYLNSLDMEQSERAYWFDVLKSSKKTKNPYGSY